MTKVGTLHNEKDIQLPRDLRMPKAALGRVPLCIDGPLIVFSGFLEQSAHVLLQASTCSIAWEEMITLTTLLC